MTSLGPANYPDWLSSVERRLGSLERHRHGTPTTNAFGQAIGPIDVPDGDPDVDPGDPTYTPPVPSTADAVVRLGVVTLTWDGNANGGEPMDPRVIYVEVHRSLEQDPSSGTVDSPVNEGFMPTPATYVDRIIAPGPGSLVMADQAYNTRWFYRLVAVTQAGVKSSPSAAVTLVTLSLTDSDIIGTVIDGQHLLPGSVDADRLSFPVDALGTELLATKVDKSSVWLNVKDYGAVGNSVTDDSAEVLACITDAVASGRNIWWPAGTYLISANLTGFWSVDHYGPGVLSVSGDTYRITNTPLGTNTVYMAAGGSNANDGLTPARPVATFGQIDLIFQRLSEKMLRGAWKVRISGNIAGGYTFAKNQRTPRPIVFEGDPLNTAGDPVTKITYVPGGSIFGLRFEPGGWVQLRNLWFVGFSVNFNGYGAITKGGGDMYVQDCRAENCDTGFAAVDQAVMGVYATYITGCTTGARAQYGSTATIGTETMPTTITNCDTGFMTTRNAVTHFDYSIVTDCGVGIMVEMAARCAMIDGVVQRNGVGVLINGTAEWTRDPNTDWGNGTANANTVNVRQHGAGHENRLQAQDTHVEWRTFVSSTAVTTSAGTNFPVIALPSVYQFEPYHFGERKEQKLRAKVYGTFTGSDPKAVRLYKVDPTGSQAVMLAGVSAVTAAGEFVLEMEVWPTTNDTQHFVSTLLVEGQTPVLLKSNAAASNDHIWRFRLYADSGETTSSVTVDMFELFITG